LASGSGLTLPFASLASLKYASARLTSSASAFRFRSVASCFTWSYACFIFIEFSSAGTKDERGRSCSTRSGLGAYARLITNFDSGWARDVLILCFRLGFIPSAVLPHALASNTACPHAVAAIASNTYDSWGQLETHPRLQIS